MFDPVVEQWWVEVGDRYRAQAAETHQPIDPHVLRADFSRWLAEREERMSGQAFSSV